MQKNGIAICIANFAVFRGYNFASEIGIWHNITACPIVYCMNMMECLPEEIAYGLSKITTVRELRLRNGKEVRVNVSGKWYYLGRDSLSLSPTQAIKVGDVCDGVVKKACNSSVYAHEKTLSNGFFTLDDGVRVGVCGHVFGKDRNTFQRYTSLCFRVPHRINVVDKQTLELLTDRNIIAIGPPSSGKTTFLRDLAEKLSSTRNVLAVDERGELFYDDRYASCDVLKWSSKSYAFEVGIRSMSPDCIVCDELSESDVEFVSSCVNSGVNVLCSAHGANVKEFDKRFGLLQCFDYAVLLQKNRSMRVIPRSKYQIMIENDET